MHALFDIVHPADVLFFHHTWRSLQAQGVAFRIMSRHKDVTVPLLDRLGWPHTPVSQAGRGVVGLARELATRDWALLQVVRRERPAVMLGFGGAAISHVTALTRIPSVSFYDTEEARLQIRMTLPFITEWHVPDYWVGPLPRRRERVHRFAGYKELAYFHPDNFQPDRDLALAAGFQPDRVNLFVRIVEWRANHDLGKQSLLVNRLPDLVSALGDQIAWHISAETDLPPALERYRYQSDPVAAHHLLAHCTCFLGESATMATEAAMLAIPAIYCSADQRGYVDQLVQFGLMKQLDQPGFDLSGELSAILDQPATHWRRIRDRVLRDKINVSDYVTSVVDRYLGQSDR